MKLSPLFSSKSFIILALGFRTLIHFELIFVYGVKQGSNFILLHLDIQFSQHHVLRRLFFYPMNGLGIFVKNHLTISVRVYFWDFYFIPFSTDFLMLILHSFDYCSFVSYEIRECRFSIFVLFPDCFGVP